MEHTLDTWARGQKRVGKGDSRAPTTDVQQAPFHAPKRRSLGARLRPNTPTAGCASAWVDTPTLGDSTPTLGESIIASPAKIAKSGGRGAAA